MASLVALTAKLLSNLTSERDKRGTIRSMIGALYGNSSCQVTINGCAVLFNQKIYANN
ncbi:MAG: hypothetical protein ACK51L_00445 [bacterium]